MGYRHAWSGVHWVRGGEIEGRVTWNMEIRLRRLHQVAIALAHLAAIARVVAAMVLALEVVRKPVQVGAKPVHEQPKLIAE